MKKYLMATHSSNQDYDADIAFAVVEIDKELAQTIMKRRKAFLQLKSQDDQLLKMAFWDHYCRYYEGSAAPEDFELPEEWRELKDDVELGEDARTECDQMLIYGDAVVFQAIPKHTDIYISTAKIAFEDIERLL